jgi:hypothetical protein
MDSIAERVCTHKFEFTIARTISLGVGSDENSITYFTRNDAKAFSKYSDMVAHHDLMRCSVTKSQHAVALSPLMIISIVSAQWRLYGITQSGSS